MEFTITLLVILSIISGVSTSFLIVARSKLKKLEQDNKRLSYMVYQLRNQIKNLESTTVKKQDKTENIDLKILELYYKGYSLRQIAKIVGLSHTTVHRRLKKLLPPEPPTTNPLEELMAT